MTTCDSNDSYIASVSKCPSPARQYYCASHHDPPCAAHILHRRPGGSLLFHHRPADARAQRLATGRCRCGPDGASGRGRIPRLLASLTALAGARHSPRCRQGRKASRHLDRHQPGVHRQVHWLYACVPASQLQLQPLLPSDSMQTRC